MKNRVITEIQTKMASILSGEQLEMLQRVMDGVLQNVELVHISSEEAQELGNNVLLKAFLSAKRVEGCSEKSLKYYEMVI